MATKPVRIDLDIYELLEREAVKRTAEREKIVQIAQVANEILGEFFKPPAKETGNARSKKGSSTRKSVSPIGGTS